MQGTIKSFKQNSQNSRILEYLKSGASLTCFEAMKMGFGMNLRSRISDLKRAGYNIVSKQIDTKNSYIAEYCLVV
jgi:oligoendopeptidase F